MQLVIVELPGFYNNNKISVSCTEEEKKLNLFLCYLYTSIKKQGWEYIRYQIHTALRKIDTLP